jgi:4,5:9,10-diseco-3-hydroxy-5,9,17-trioxoandrosta-1(10),2-diene-4-oate hydrolase
MHANWKLNDPAAVHVETAMFAKNLSILGAAILISQFGAGSISIDERRSGNVRAAKTAVKLSRSDSLRGSGSVRSTRGILSWRARVWTRFLLWVTAAGFLLLFALLFGAGILGSDGRRINTANYRAAVGAQPPNKMIVLNGVQIAYTDSGGSGSVLICLHAIGHGARDFEDLSRRLRPQFRVLALDFPGQGNAGPDSESASATRYAELLSGFIDRLGLASVTLIGNSIGGAAAIRYASSHPELVKALVLCDTGGLGRPTLASRIFIAGFVQFFAAGRRGAFWFPWAFGKYYKHVLIMPPAQQERNRIIRSAYEIALPLETAWRSFADSNENLLPLLPKLHCPVLLAWAKKDFVIPLDDVEPSFALFRDYRLQVFEGGHAAFLEDPDRFESALRAFLHDYRLD